MRCSLPDLRQYLNRLVHFLAKCSLFWIKSGPQQAQWEGEVLGEQGEHTPHSKASLVPTTAKLNRIKWVQRDHGQLKRVVRDPVGPPLPQSHPLTPVDFSSPCVKLPFHSIAWQNVASLYIPSSPYRNVGQKHTSYRDSVSGFVLQTPTEVPLTTS